ncbi:MAG TPA: hypothetical protein VGS80_08740 [Ktedonobacterales bacterium]|nr:hypothetical protein [Ktedonobacterales bacterium]
MDERYLPRRRPGMPQPPRHCQGCRQPLVVARTRAVWVRGTLHAFDRCAGCGRESGRPATVEEWRRLGYVKQPHVRGTGVGVSHPVGTEDEPLWDWSEDDGDDWDQPSPPSTLLPRWLVGGAFVAGALGLGALAARWGLLLPPPEDKGGQSGTKREDEKDAT